MPPSNCLTTHLKPTIDICCFHVQEELLVNQGFYLVGQVGSDRELDHGVWGRAPGNNSLDSTAWFAIPRVNTAPMSHPKPTKQFLFGIFFTKLTLPPHHTDKLPKIGMTSEKKLKGNN